MQSPVMQSLRARLGVAVLALLWTTSAGAATTYDMSVNIDPVMCAQFLKMVKAADFAHMTNKQLCEFEFSQLPSSVTKGFTFLHWRKMSVANGPDLYVKMLHANRSPGSVARKPDYVKGRRDAEKAASMGVLAFYTAQVPVSAVTPRGFPLPKPPTAGSNEWTILSMRQTECPSPVTFISGRYSVNSFFETPGLKLPIPGDIGLGGGLTLWKSKLFALFQSVRWRSNPYTIHPGVGLSFGIHNLTWFTSMGMDNPRDGTGVISGGTYCNVNIVKSAKE